MSGKKDAQKFREDFYDERPQKILEIFTRAETEGSRRFFALHYG